MNYRHAYHAGNFADVFKHAIFCALISELQKKPKPIAILDTHAGLGLYDLTSTAARKTGEAQAGIGRVYAQLQTPPLLAPFIDALTRLNGGLETIKHYPGSPKLARDMLRADDRAVFVELHDEDAAELKHHFAGDRQVAVHCADGYQALKAFLPPKERRGLVLIDPPFEELDEFAKIQSSLLQACEKWPQGVYAVWYPIKDRLTIKRFHNQMRDSAIRNILVAELGIFADEVPTRLNGCGMMIVNPPWQFERGLKTALAWLAPLLAENGKGANRVEWLVPE